MVGSIVLSPENILLRYPPPVLRNDRSQVTLLIVIIIHNSQEVRKKGQESNAHEIGTNFLCFTLLLQFSTFLREQLFSCRCLREGFSGTLLPAT